MGMDLINKAMTAVHAYRKLYKIGAVRNHVKKGKPSVSPESSKASIDKMSMADRRIDWWYAVKKENPPVSFQRFPGFSTPSSPTVSDSGSFGSLEYLGKPSNSPHSLDALSQLGYVYEPK